MSLLIMQFKKSILFLYNYYRVLRGYPTLYNVNKVDDSEYSKRALFVYLTKPFKLKPNDKRFYYHQNFKQCLQIASIIGEFGYIVDVADIRAKKIKDQHIYDLVISHKYNLDLKKLHLRHNALKIYLSTGINHIVSNKNLKKRYGDIAKMRHCQLTPRRFTDENMVFVGKADYIAGFGNAFTMSTWNQHFDHPSYYFNNYGFELDLKLERSFEYAKSNFLYFASAGNVLKGLAHLLEVFSKLPKVHLYVCGSFKNETDFCKCYHRELNETDNIHAIGWVSIDSEKYRNIINECAFVVLPSCSEGQAGSVVQCMHAGLIPVVTREVGIDTEDFGITFKNDSLEEIEKTILELSQKPAGWVKQKSEATLKIAKEKYSEQAFLKRWREILSDILEKENLVEAKSESTNVQ